MTVEEKKFGFETSYLWYKYKGKHQSNAQGIWKLERWFQKGKVKRQKKQLFLGHHLNTSCGGSTSKNTSVLMTVYHDKTETFHLISQFVTHETRKDFFR